MKINLTKEEIKLLKTSFKVWEEEEYWDLSEWKHISDKEYKEKINKLKKKLGI